MGQWKAEPSSFCSLRSSSSARCISSYLEKLLKNSLGNQNCEMPYNSPHRIINYLSGQKQNKRNYSCCAAGWADRHRWSELASCSWKAGFAQYQRSIGSAGAHTQQRSFSPSDSLPLTHAYTQLTQKLVNTHHMLIFTCVCMHYSHIIWLLI